LPLIRDSNEKLRDFAIGGYYGFAWSIITDDYSYIHWLPNEVTTTEEMLKKVYDGAGMSAGEDTKGLQTDDMWTCTPHAKVEIPERDQLFNRREDPFQLNNIIEANPDIAEDLLKKLKLFIGELRTS
jgi:hypothetical protein